MNNYLKYILSFVILFTFVAPQTINANENKKEELNVGELILGHLGDDYGWHITTIGDTHITLPLPIILYSDISGVNIFMSSKLNHGKSEHNGFYIASEGDYKGKIVEKNKVSEVIRPWDFSITRNVLGLLMASAIVLTLVLTTAKWHKRRGKQDIYESPKGVVGFMEMFIMNIHDEVIIPCVGKNYKKFSPYLLTAFFFIFVNNLLGLIPGIVPGIGANVTGNIATTIVLGLFTFFIVNFFGTKEYAKEIFWPDVPLFLKTPILPIMQIVEILGVFTKPFSLIIRLFANIFAGHTIMLGLTSLIFVTASMGAAVLTSMTFVSVAMSIFMSFLELLVAFIQAYVFTMLSAVFIGLAQVEPHHVHQKIELEKETK